ncbi:MAG: hypothetical protein RIM72_06120 [Alphaproteobacteria bacterium]
MAIAELHSARLTAALLTATTHLVGASIFCALLFVPVGPDDRARYVALSLSLVASIGFAVTFLGVRYAERRAMRIAELLADLAKNVNATEEDRIISFMNVGGRPIGNRLVAMWIYVVPLSVAIRIVVESTV